MKRILSLILVVSLMVSSVINVSAASITSKEEKNEIVKMKDGSVKLVDPNDSETYVIGNDLKNGDVEFTQYQGNEIVSRYIVKSEERVIEATYYQKASDIKNSSELTREPVIRTETIKMPDLMTETKSLLGTTGGYIGTIKYNYSNGTNAGICGAKVNYIKNTGSIKYNINGTYQDLAGLASFIVGVLALPVAPALAVSKATLTWLGIGFGAASILIPDINLQSDYDETEYFLENIDDSDHTNSFYGTKYIITDDGNHIDEVKVEGTYYAYSPWEDIVFGMTVYSFMFWYQYYNINSWN